MHTQIIWRDLIGEEVCKKEGQTQFMREMLRGLYDIGMSNYVYDEVLRDVSTLVQVYVEAVKSSSSVYWRCVGCEVSSKKDLAM